MPYKFGYLIILFFLVISASTFAQVKVLNKGIGGNNTYDLLSRIEKDVLAEVPDLVILLVGSNDMVNSKKLVPYAQYRENYQTLIGQLRARNIEIVVMSLLPVDTGYVLNRHGRNAFSEDLNTRLDSAGQIIKGIARKNNLHFFDLNKKFKATGSPNRTVSSLTINQANFGKEDGIHPTKEGYAFIAEELYAFLKKKRLLTKIQKIVCFGDSITYGSFMMGAGTTEGDTYPAALRREIENNIY